MATPAILGLGNPLLDISVEVKDLALLDRYGLKMGNAILAAAEHQPLYAEIVRDFAGAAGGVQYIAGGATQNTIRVAQWVSGKPAGYAAYVGAVGDDAFGKTLAAAAAADGVSALYEVTAEKPTGTCAVLVHEQERSLVANLAAAETLREAHLDSAPVAAAIASARVVYCAGFPLTHAGGAASVQRLGKACAEGGKIFATNLSAPFIVQVRRAAASGCAAPSALLPRPASHQNPRCGRTRKEGAAGGLSCRYRAGPPLLPGIQWGTAIRGRQNRCCARAGSRPRLRGCRITRPDTPSFIDPQTAPLPYLDPPTHPPTRQFFKETLDKVLPFADFVFGNELEAEAFAGANGMAGASNEAVALKIASLPKASGARARVAVITQGAKPTIVAENGAVRHFEVPPVAKIVDVNGAGDAFVGGFIAIIAAGGGIDAAVKAGTWAAAHVIGRSGATFDASVKYHG